jgi:16S rRNA (adenine1518-N6/adenine1519-N6)-dimethyltransferase
MKKFRQKKSLGQHFLKDKNIVRKIADLAEIEENESVWEVGPGRGILTQELLLQKCNLTCFEIDETLYPILFEKFGTTINLINKDILKINWKDYLDESKLKIVANLPYQITSPFLFRVTENAANFKRVVVMIQKEVAVRINAGVGTKDYGRLSLKMQFYFNVEYGFTVKPHLFFPPPKVDSAVIILTPRKDKPILEDENLFWRIVEVAFQNRRKMLRRNLRIILSIEKIEVLGNISNIDLTRRGETLTELDFIELYDDVRKLDN